MRLFMKTSVVALGLLFSVGLNAQQARHNKHMRAEHAKAKVEELKKELNLTDEQEAKVMAILKEHREEVKETKPSKEEREEMMAKREKVKEERKEIRNRTDAKLKEVLSPEQMEKYMAIREEHQEERREKMKERLERKSDGEQMHRHKKGEDHNHH